MTSANDQAARGSAARTPADHCTAWGADTAIIYGSGLAATPENATVISEIPYADLGWPCTAVPGHANMLLLASVPIAGGRKLKLALACGRPHLYEGWTAAELERPLRALATGGVRRFVLVNACGGLGASSPGDTVVCETVVDLQRPPLGAAPDRLVVCTRAQASTAAAALEASMLVSPGSGRCVRGDYVAVSGPQFETPAEARWLAAYGDVVGMSAAPEARAAADVGASCMLVACVANRAGELGSHDDVLAATQASARRLSGGLVPMTLARWPELLRLPEKVA